MVGDGEIESIAEVIRRGYLGMGLETRAFEEELETFLGGGTTVVCVNSGTAALHLALQACGVGPEDEVVVPSLTFVSSFQAITACGARPIACDSRLNDGNLDVDDARRRITSRTAALMPVHFASQTYDVDGVTRLSEEFGLRVIEDAAHAFGCQHGGHPVGSAGDVVCFSFDGIKNITSGEGGAVVTADQDVAERVRDARLLGVQKDTERRYRSERSWDFDVTEQGFRYHMSDIMAAIGRRQLTRFEPEFAPRRVELASRYRERLDGLDGVELFECDLGNVIPHIFPIRITDGRRDAVRRHLVQNGCEVGIHYKPNHLLSRFRQSVGHLPVAELLGSEILSIPLHPLLTDAEQDAVVVLLEDLLSAKSAPN